MFCKGIRCVGSLSSLHRAARQRLLRQPVSRSISLTSAARIDAPQSSPEEEIPNLDTVPTWSMDPRTQQWRPGSNWNYDKELFTLARRLGDDLESLPSLQTALTHRSAMSSSQNTSEENSEQLPLPHTPKEHNSRLSFLGNSLMRYYVVEHLLKKYPNMEADGLGDIAEFLLNNTTLVKCADHLGITDLILTRTRLDDPSKQKIIVRALEATLSCVHLDCGPAAARKFVAEFVTSKMVGVDLHEVIKLQHPRYILRTILASLDMPKPESRILKETGRVTHFPTFVVGVYSGEKLLGSGCGTSLKRAEREAIVAALHKHFATQLAAMPLPQDYDRERDIEFFQTSREDVQTDREKEENDKQEEND